MKLLCAALLPIILIVSCNKRPKLEQESKVASWSIDKLEVEGSKPQWDKLKLSMTRTLPVAPPLKIDKQYKKEDFASASKEDASVTVEYGTYKVTFEYFSKDDQLLYKECEAETKKEHIINTATYTAPVEICSMDSEVPVDTVVIAPSAKVTLSPRLAGSGQPNTGTPPASGSSSVQVNVPSCSGNGNFLATIKVGTSEYKIDIGPGCKPTIKCEGTTFTASVGGASNRHTLPSPAACTEAKAKIEEKLR